MMNKYQGDSKWNRLLPFLSRKEMTVEDVKKIKQDVYWVKSQGNEYALKCYESLEKLEKQHTFFEQWKEASLYAAEPLSYPDGSRVISNADGEWGLFNWLKGDHLLFSYKSDRSAASKVVQEFHASTEGIETPLLLQNPLYIKYQRRLEQFEKTFPAFSYGGNRTLFQELHQFASKTLDDFERLDWAAIEEDAWERKTWLHGDVAHHNFIRTRDGAVKLIDFDLLQMGPELYDEIQLGQRFLPHTHHSLKELTVYFHATKWKEAWLKGILVPSDLMREWLYVYRKYKRQDQKLAGHLDWLHAAWKDRKEFVEKVQHVLR